MITRPLAKFAALVTAGAFLAACESESAPPPVEDDGRATAEGEVLGGTISDEMLPLDTLRSQSPPQGSGSGSGGSSAEGSTEVETDAASEPEEAVEAEVEQAE
ncbi:hypothetical protein A3736_13080 [Erythrobacter sp. HI0063]|jgi:hypothetical protein|uniref:hypothetical protein n=1 Tax=Erythrobacter sp. HI0063 TaxID=1822240 RepID=UPI0007C27C3E|nr:hypothetical protein [Erythrobacter sp. HI0063]KZY54834.1 hypothetical protein A3736_13080 [Erythrobacter sp. HI0063]|tara:strand:- start:21 stop:329 length:309 start_codon:yes stop_codon:yes gene_type:complete